MSDPYHPPELRDAGGTRQPRPVPGGTLAALLGETAAAAPAIATPSRPDGTLGRLLAGDAAGGAEPSAAQPPSPAAAAPSTPPSPATVAASATPVMGPAEGRNSRPWLTVLLVLLGVAVVAHFRVQLGS